MHLTSYSAGSRRRGEGTTRTKYEAKTDCTGNESTRNEAGLPAEFQFNRFPSKPNFPGILGVKLGTVGHFIASLGREGDQLTIADPLVGQEIVTLQELKRPYSISGFFLQIH